MRKPNNDLGQIVKFSLLSFLVGVVFGVASYDLAVDNNAIRAKCNSVSGNYGGGKCFINGVEIDNN